MKKIISLMVVASVLAFLYSMRRGTRHAENAAVDRGRGSEDPALQSAVASAVDPAGLSGKPIATVQKVNQKQQGQAVSSQPVQATDALLDVGSTEVERQSLVQGGGALEAKPVLQVEGSSSAQALEQNSAPAIPVAGTRSNPVRVPGSTSGSAALANGIDPNKPYFLPPGESPVQSPARPMDLEIIGEVQASVEDSGYTHFIMDTLKELTPRLETHFEKRDEIVEGSLEAEFEDLILEEDAYVRIYFIKEGTVFHNSLGIGLENEDKLIFPDASSVVSYFRDGDTRREAASEEVPLLPGDYVDLGVMEAGSLLDFFLIQDGARNEEGRIYGLDKESNPDKANHIRIHDVVDENTLIIGFEDLPGGGDQDYNDLVIAVEKIPVEQE